MVELDLDELRRRLAGAGITDVTRTRWRCVQPHLSRRAGRPGSGDQGCPARRRAGRAPRRSAPGPHHQSACRDTGSGPRGAVGGPGNPPHTPPLFVMSHVEGDCVEPLFDGCAPTADLAERYRNACRAMAALHSLSPIELGLGGEPVIDPVAEVRRWCDTLQTVDAALVPGLAGCARCAVALRANGYRAQRGARRLPVRQPDGRRSPDQRGNRLGDLVDR